MNDYDRELRERFAEYDREAKEEAEKWIERLGLEGAQAESYRRATSKWILIDGEPVEVGLLEWARWSEDHHNQKIIGRDDVISPGGREFQVSTVFLGLDHSFGMPGPPILFETMIFDYPRINKRLAVNDDGSFTYNERVGIRYDGWQMRYASIEQAQLGHKLTMQMVAEGLDDWTEHDD